MRCSHVTPAAAGTAKGIEVAGGCYGYVGTSSTSPTVTVVTSTFASCPACTTYPCPSTSTLCGDRVTLNFAVSGFSSAGEPCVDLECSGTIEFTWNNTTGVCYATCTLTEHSGMQTPTAIIDCTGGLWEFTLFTVPYPYSVALDSLFIATDAHGCPMLGSYPIRGAYASISPDHDCSEFRGSLTLSPH